MSCDDESSDDDVRKRWRTATTCDDHDAWQCTMTRENVRQRNATTKPDVVMSRKKRCTTMTMMYNDITWCLVTNLIHDFTAMTFSVKLAFFREKCRFAWNPWFFVNFSAFSLIYDNSQVLSTAFVWMLLFATCRTSAPSSWHWLSWVLT